MLKFLLLFCVMVCVSGQDQNTKAHCVFNGDGTGNVKGYVNFYQEASKKNIIKVTAKADNVPKGKHGFHIHEEGKLGNNCADAKGHLNPTKANHAAPQDQSRHLGDLGNVESTDENKLDLNNFEIMFGDSNTNLADFIGKALVLHEKADDLGKGGNDESLKTGNAGSRIACCIVEKNEYSAACSVTRHWLVTLQTIFSSLFAFFLASN